MKHVYHRVAAALLASALFSAPASANAGATESLIVANVYGFSYYVESTFLVTHGGPAVSWDRWDFLFDDEGLWMIAASPGEDPSQGLPNGKAILTSLTYKTPVGEQVCDLGLYFSGYPCPNVVGWINMLNYPNLVGQKELVVPISVVPEPKAMALLLFGSLVLGWRRLRCS